MAFKLCMLIVLITFYKFGKKISKMAEIFDDVTIFCKILKMMTSSKISAIMKKYYILFEELPPYYHPVKFHSNIFYI